jgi:hypothetical protein
MDRDCQDRKDKSSARMKCFIAFMLHSFFFILLILSIPVNFSFDELGDQVLLGTLRTETMSVYLSNCSSISRIHCDP